MDRIDFQGLADALLRDAENLLAQWFPHGVQRGHEFTIGDISGSEGDSLSINVTTGQWCDFGRPEHKGGDLISLYAAHRGLTQLDAARELSGQASKLLAVPPTGPKAARKTSKWTPVLPVPSDTPQPPDRFARNEGSSKAPRWVDGRFVRRWTYHDADGRLLGHVARFHWVDADTGEIEKDVVPQTWCVDDAGKHAWRTRSFPVPRPLYGLRELAERPDAPVIVVEGEKSADAARQIAPQYVVVTWPGGVEAWRKAALNPLRGRPSVLLWPDADEPGVKGMWEVGHALFAMCPTVKIILPSGKPDGWDAYDARAEGWGWREFKEWALPLAVLITEQGAGNARRYEVSRSRDAAGSQAADTGRAGGGAGPADQAGDRADGGAADDGGEPGDGIQAVHGGGAGDGPVRGGRDASLRPDAEAPAVASPAGGPDRADPGADAVDRLDQRSGLDASPVQGVGLSDRRPSSGSHSPRPGTEGRAPDGADGDRGVLGDAAAPGPDGADREDRSAVSRAPVGLEGAQGVARAAGTGGSGNAVATATTEPQSQVARWISWGLDRNGNGLPLTNLNNAVAVLENDPVLRGLVWFDEFLQRLMTGAPAAREWADADDVNLTLYMQRAVGLSKIGVDTVRQSVIAVAYRHTRNCVLDWTESLRHDGVERIEQFFQDIFGAEDTAYVRAVGRNFWISIAARIYKPGCKVDNMIVLEGFQGKGKSTAMQIVGGEWFTEQHETATNPKAFAEILQGKLITEIAEMDAFSRAEVNRVKAVVSAPHDRYRGAFERHAKDHKRQGVFVGTTNRDDWNKDETGARRFWPIRCLFVNLDAVQANRSQYFAEAVAVFKRVPLDAGPAARIAAQAAWWEMPEEETKAEQAARYDADPWMETVARFVGQLPSVTVAEVMQEALKIEVAKFTRADQMRVATCLRVLGWTAKDERRSGRVVKVWRSAGQKVATQVEVATGRNTQPVDSPIPF